MSIDGSERFSKGAAFLEQVWITLRRFSLRKNRLMLPQIRSPRTTGIVCRAAPFLWFCTLHLTCIDVSHDLHVYRLWKGLNYIVGCVPHCTCCQARRPQKPRPFSTNILGSASRPTAEIFLRVGNALPERMRFPLPPGGGPGGKGARTGISRMSGILRTHTDGTGKPTGFVGFVPMFLRTPF